MQEAGSDDFNQGITKDIRKCFLLYQIFLFTIHNMFIQVTNSLNYKTHIVTLSAQVILSVPQYKSTAASSLSSGASADSSSSDLSQNSLTVTPVLKLNSPDQEDPADDEAEEEEEGEDDEDEEEEELEDAKRSTYTLDNILSNQTQSFFSLEQFKQASLIFQKHTTMNGNGLKGSSEFLQHSIWNNLVSSTVPASDSSNDEKRKIHKCDFPSCDKIYTKSSHLKAHKRYLQKCSKYFFSIWFLLLAAAAEVGRVCWLFRRRDL